MQIPDHLSDDQWDTKVARQWKERQRLHSGFWARWRNEYLASLQPFQKWTQEGKAPKIGQVVLLEDAPRVRSEWPMARVLETFQGRDGLVRSVLLFVRWSDKPIRRDVRKIYRLEEDGSINEPTAEEAEVAPSPPGED